MRDTPARSPEADERLSACVVSLLELDWAQSPARDGPVGVERWNEWLAGRNLRLVATRELPASGYWLGHDGGERWMVMFGSPPDVVWTADGGHGPPGEVREALVVVPLDPVLALTEPSVGSVSGVVEALYLAPAATAPMRAVRQADVVAGRGLRGDRYFDGAGTFSKPGASGHALTLIEAEALEAMETEHGIGLAPEQARRNVVTRGTDLNALVGARFFIGEVQCVGARWCEPCAHLQRLTAPGVLRGLVHRGGLRADLLTDGTLRVGDALRLG